MTITERDTADAAENTDQGVSGFGVLKHSDNHRRHGVVGLLGAVASSERI